MITESRTANAIGAKTARACDSCLRRRARWFCPADDAFLCQSCDTSVHSANQLASRHERVRLETASSKGNKELKRDDENSSLPFWHQGFTRKPRTPRGRRYSKNKDDDMEKVLELNPGALVPEISGEETNYFPDENEEQIMYRVPVLDPFGDELCNESLEFDDLKVLLDDHEAGGLNIPGFISSGMELEEFAVDVENLLGAKINEGPCGLIEDLDGFEDKRLKINDGNDQELGAAALMDCQFDPGLDLARESSFTNYDFGYSSSALDGEEEEMGRRCEIQTMSESEKRGKWKKGISLKLNYEAIITAWDCQGSPWTNGIRPDFNPDDCWPDCMGIETENQNGPYGGGQCGSREREARVLRYREKRRTRLFSKKIRYEVRKLNAEKRPRMKGRFVKRTAFASSSYPSYLINK